MNSEFIQSNKQDLQRFVPLKPILKFIVENVLIGIER
jgi:hypothetical protein